MKPVLAVRDEQSRISFYLIEMLDKASKALHLSLPLKDNIDVMQGDTITWSKTEKYSMGKISGQLIVKLSLKLPSDNDNNYFFTSRVELVKDHHAVDIREKTYSVTLEELTQEDLEKKTTNYQLIHDKFLPKLYRWYNQILEDDTVIIGKFLFAESLL